MLAPPAIILRTTPTVIRIPRMVGCPRHTAGSISIRSRGGTSIGLREIDVRTSSLSSVVPVLASTDSRRLKKSPPATPLALPAPDCPLPPSAAGHPASRRPRPPPPPHLRRSHQNKCLHAHRHVVPDHDGRSGPGVDGLGAGCGRERVNREVEDQGVSILYKLGVTHDKTPSQSSLRRRRSRRLRPIRYS